MEESFVTEWATDGGRKPRPKRARPGMSVYPPSETGQILGGRRSIPFTQAIRCWATLLAPAAQANDREFTRREWIILARALGQVEHAIQPESNQPEVLIAGWLDRWVMSGGAAAAGTSALEVQRVAEKVRGLDYVRAWSLLWSLQHRVKQDIDLDSMEEWWGLEHRRRSIPPVDTGGE